MHAPARTPTNTRWYRFVYEFQSAAEAPVELVEVLQRRSGWSHAVFFPRMEAHSGQPVSPPSVCVLHEDLLCLYRIGDNWDVACQDIPLPSIDRIVLQLYLLACSIEIFWPGGSARLRLPAYGAEPVVALSRRLTGPDWEKTVMREPVLGYGVEISWRRPGSLPKS